MSLPSSQDNAGLEERPSKHLWLGNLNARLPRTILKAWFETFGPVDDVVTFPGRMYAFVNFHNPEDARAARDRLDDQQVRHQIPHEWHDRILILAKWNIQLRSALKLNADRMRSLCI